MFEAVNEVSVLVAAILAIAVGSIWYSPLLFEKQWMAAVGLTADDMEASKAKMPKMFAFAAITNLALLFIVAQFVEFVRVLNIPLSTMALWLIAFLTASAAGAVIWEQKPLSYLLINIGYSAIVILGGMSVIYYWPW